MINKVVIKIKTIRLLYTTKQNMHNQENINIRALNYQS